MTTTESEIKTVWIVNDAGHDYTEAERYGNIRALTLGDINPFQVDRLWFHLCRAAPEIKIDDYLLISGTPVVNALALLMWMLKWETCELLQWHAKERKYILSTLDLANFEVVLARLETEGNQ